MVPSSQVTVVVPAYNVAEYIGECLASVLANGGRQCAILVIDDGSTDDTAAVAARALRGVVRAQVVTVPNGGQAAARNIGLDRCETPFVTFVDADDRIAPKGLSLLFAAGDDDVDIVFSNRDRFADASRQRRPQVFFRDQRRVSILSIRWRAKVMAVHGKLFRTAFLRDAGIRFPDGIVWEDIPFSYRTYLAAGLVSATAATTYDWRRRAGDNLSTMQKLLTPHCLNSRFEQIRQTIRLGWTEEGKRMFGKGWVQKEFGSRLRMHITSMRRSSDEEAVRRCFAAIREFAYPYRRKILRRLDPAAAAEYRRIFDGDVDYFLTRAREAAAAADAAAVEARRKQAEAQRHELTSRPQKWQSPPGRSRWRILARVKRWLRIR